MKDEETDILQGRSSSKTAGSIGRADTMPDVLDSNKAAFATLLEQRLMVTIIRRAVNDLPCGPRFFQPDNGTFHLCCEAPVLDPVEIKADKQVQEMHK